MSKRNPFIPDDLQDETFDLPVDKRIKYYMDMQQAADVEPEIGYSDSCPQCWLSSGFKTKFIAGGENNKICDLCINISIENT